MNSLKEFEKAWGLSPSELEMSGGTAGTCDAIWHSGDGNISGNPYENQPYVGDFPPIQPIVPSNPFITSPNILPPTWPTIGQPNSNPGMLPNILTPFIVSEKDRVFEQLCLHIPDDIVRKYWLDTEECNKNPIESGMNFLANYIMTKKHIDNIL